MKGKMSEWAPLPLRLMLGISFIYHGFPKITGEGHQNFVGMLSRIGVPAAGATAWAVGMIEFVAGIALLLGAFVAIFSILLTIDMLVALLKVHLAAGFGFINIKSMGPEGPVFGLPGYEVNLLYIAGLLALVLGGAGALSFDGLRAKSGRRSRAVAPPL